MANFSIDLNSAITKANSNMDTVVRKVVLDLGTSIVFGSPVDTGRFRANWQYAFGRVPSGTLDVLDKSGQGSIDKINAGLKFTEGIHYLTNNLPYAQRLEDGYSKQAPAGMVGLTILRFSGIVSLAASGVKK